MIRLICASSVLVLVLGASGCSNGRDAGAPLPPVDDPPPLAHIHGLGVNPADGVLFAATHSGLYRIEDGRASIVANRYQDTMGFTVAGPDRFIGGGHPDLREGLPSMLGLIESRDAGVTWTQKSMLGVADFHALRVVDGVIWAYDSASSTLMVTQDGEKWDERSSFVLRDFVVSPRSSDVVLAANGQELRMSDDGGRAWERADAAPPQPFLLAWESAAELWLVAMSGVVYMSDDSGRSWKERGTLPGPPEAFIDDGGTLYAASKSEIFVSDDGAKTWRSIFSGRDRRTS